MRSAATYASVSLGRFRAPYIASELENFLYLLFLYSGYTQKCTALYSSSGLADRSRIHLFVSFNLMLFNDVYFICQMEEV